jgi:hypothetical protein
MQQIVQILLVVSMISMVHGAEDSRWPGLPPDCWPESRNVHSGEAVDLEINTFPSIRFSHETQSPSGDPVYSANGGYYFITDGFRPESSLFIFAEKPTHWKISFTDTFYGAQPTWINEKLLFIRVYGGRIAFVDMVVDVENEEVIYTERGVDGYIAFQQYKDGCKELGGCECIQKG